jgi:hypothetical protein
MDFMAKIHQFFQLLASLSRNLINTNKIEVADDKFDIKNVAIAVKLASKFFRKMQEHVDDNSIPRDVPAFARSFFAKASEGGDLLSHQRAMTPKNQVPPNQLMAPAVESVSQMAKKQQGQKKPKKEFLDKSLKMGLFHVKTGTPASKALPDKSTLKDGAGICMDFCSHKKKCTYPHQLCKNEKHYTNWKNIPNEDKITLLKHMNSLGLMWLDAKTFEKHKIVIAPQLAHLLGDSMGPKQKAEKGA